MKVLIQYYDMILVLLPLIALQLGLAIYCTVKIAREGVQNFNKGIWIVLCLFVQLIGPVAFLMWGRKEEYR